MKKGRKEIRGNDALYTRCEVIIHVTVLTNRTQSTIELRAFHYYIKTRENI